MANNQKVRQLTNLVNEAKQELGKLHNQLATYAKDAQDGFLDDYDIEMIMKHVEAFIQSLPDHII